MIEIDGSFGEGGGQVLRTSLALSALTGQPVHIRRVRARRGNPGLAPQHLTGLLALAKICRAEVKGAHLRSTEIVFQPQAPPCAGEYVFDVTSELRTTQGGSAGGVTLILQTLLLPLAFAGAPSHITLKGGTQVQHSPPFHYFAHVFRPIVAQMGVRADVRLEAWGFYPVGGGQISADLWPLSALAPLSLMERGELKKIWGLAVAANLPAHIPQRMANRTRNVLADKGLTAEITPSRERSAGPGAGLVLVAEYERALAGFSSVGERGKPSEKVAEEACLDLLEHHASGVPVDLHLADQLLLPMALAAGRSEFRTSRVTQHLLTNAHVIRQFVPAEIKIEGKEGEAGGVAVEGIGMQVNR